MKNKIQLGDKVRDIHTGFTGIAVAKTTFLNGCVQINVVPRWDKKTNPNEQEIAIDEGSLEIIKAVKREEETEWDDEDSEEENGGPTRRPNKFRGY